MIDLRAHALLREELGERRPLPYLGRPDELRTLAAAFFGPPSRQPRGGSPAVVMAAAVAAAAFRYWGTHGGGTQRALDAVLHAALEAQPQEQELAVGELHG